MGGVDDRSGVETKTRLGAGNLELGTEAGFTVGEETSVRESWVEVEGTSGA